MKGKIEVTKIVIRMGDKDAELTIEQARELKDALSALLGKDEKVVYIPQPYEVYRPYRPYWYVTYGDTTGITTDGTTSVTYSLTN